MTYTCSAQEKKKGSNSRHYCLKADEAACDDCISVKRAGQKIVSSFTDFTQDYVGGTASGETYESRIIAMWRKDADPQTPYAP